MSHDPSDIDLDKPVAGKPRDIKRRSGWQVGTLSAVAVLVLALVLAYMYLRTSPDQPAPAADAPAGRPEIDRNPEPGEQIPLPPLDETDALVRQLIGRLSSHPTVAAWLTTDGLILNFAVVTLQIANGESPVQELRAIGPVPPFRAHTSRGDLFIDPSSYRRYDRYAEAVSALDSRGTARLYATLKPRVLDAYRRLGHEREPVVRGAGKRHEPPDGHVKAIAFDNSHKQVTHTNFCPRPRLGLGRCGQQVRYGQEHRHTREMSHDHHSFHRTHASGSMGNRQADNVRHGISSFLDLRDVTWLRVDDYLTDGQSSKLHSRFLR